MATTANMHLTLPTPGETNGPEWAQAINDALEDGVDTHDHTSGKGVPVPVAGLDIDSDLPLNGNNIDDARMARFEDQTATLSELTDMRGLYVVSGDLYYNNGSGTAVRITNGAGLSGASLGNIDNLPSVAFPTASLAWLDAFPGFALYQATNVYARIRSAEIELHESGATSPNAVTLKSPASLASDYDFTFPAAPPASDAFLTMNALGTLSTQVRAGGIGTTDLANEAVTTAKIADENVTTAKIADENVTRAKMAAVGQQVSPRIVWVTTSSTFAAVTNMTVSITTTGRPVVVAIIPDSDGLSAYATIKSLADVSGGFLTAGGDIEVRVTGDTTETIARQEWHVFHDSTSSSGVCSFSWPAGYMTLWVPAAGDYTLSVYAAKNADAANFSLNQVKLVAYEL